MSEQRPSSELETQLWARYGTEMRAVLAEAPELTPEQIKAIRAALPRKVVPGDHHLLRR